VNNWPGTQDRPKVIFRDPPKVGDGASFKPICSSLAACWKKFWPNESFTFRAAPSFGIRGLTRCRSKSVGRSRFANKYRSKAFPKYFNMKVEKKILNWEKNFRFGGGAIFAKNLKFA
jgi:hypothetical protein